MVVHAYNPSYSGQLEKKGKDLPSTREALSSIPSHTHTKT
jgi:hypothetical protein